MGFEAQPKLYLLLVEIRYLVSVFKEKRSVEDFQQFLVWLYNFIHYFAGFTIFDNDLFLV